MSGLDEKGLTDRITDYLSCGGLFNPEMMEHEKVRDLLIDCRAYIAASAPPAPDGLVERLRKHYDHARITHHFKAAYTIEEVSATLSAQEAEIERLRKQIADMETSYDNSIQEMSERFRAVNIAKAIEQSGVNFISLAARAEHAEAEVARLQTKEKNNG